MAVAKPSYYRNTWLWNLGFSAYWFATSYKWFILLLVVVPAQVKAIVPEGEKNSAWGTVYALGALWGTLGPALFGGWSDRFDSKWGHRQPFIFWGAVISVGALLFMMNAATLPLLIVGYFLLQLGEDVGQGPYAAMMPEIVPEEHAGMASSVMNLLQSLARLVAGLAYAVWQTVPATYIAVAVVQILGAGTTLATVKNVRRSKPVSEIPRSSFWARWLAPWKSPDFRWVWITRFLSTLAFAMVSNYLLFYLTDMFRSYKVFGYDLKTPEVAVTALALFMSVLGVVGAGIASRLADSWGRKPLVYLGGFVIFAVLVPFALARNLDVIFLLAVPFGIGFGIYVSADWALATDVLPDRDEAGTQMGVWSMSMSSVQIFVGAAGPLVDWGNRFGHGFGYIGVIWTAGLIFVVSTALIKNVRASS
ncbi:MAG: MFS transporter [Armatimonadetes bacterium]|nr:MFS transporter [Armatimonadota bacterium]